MLKYFNLFILSVQDNWVETTSLRHELAQCQLTVPRLQNLLNIVQIDSLMHQSEQASALEQQEVLLRQPTQHPHLSKTSLLLSHNEHSLYRIPPVRTSNLDKSLLQTLFNNGISKKAFLNDDISLDITNKITSLPITNEYDKNKLVYFNVNNINDNLIKIEDSKGSHEIIRNIPEVTKHSKLEIKIKKNVDLSASSSNSIHSEQIAQATLIDKLLPQSHLEDEPTKSSMQTAEHKDSYVKKRTISSLELPINSTFISDSTAQDEQALRISDKFANILRHRTVRDIPELPPPSNLRQKINHKYLTAHPSQSSATTIKVSFGPTTQLQGSSNVYKELLNSRLRDDESISSAISNGPNSLDEVI